MIPSTQSNTPTPTPRTDEQQFTALWSSSCGFVVETDFARQLEREVIDLTASLAAANERVKALDWQPIETAPKDGSGIVAIGYAFGKSEKGYHDPVLTWYEDGLWQTGGDYECDNYVYLTHWMPMPKPPAT